MTKTLLGQNILVLLGTTFFALVLSLSLIAVFVIRPEAQRAANFTWGLAEVLAFSVERMDPRDRVELLQRIDNQPDINVKVSSAPPPDPAPPGSFAERVFLNELRVESERSALQDWRVGDDGLFWMRLPDDDPPIWVSLRTLPSPNPITVVSAVFAVSLLTSVIGGFVLQRHLARPLRTLTQQVEEINAATGLLALDESGPREVAAVSRALNDMTDKMREAEKDRSVMLAGVSHDLRTPLTKLRLSLAMLNGSDPELLISADQQVARIEAMLGQFLDYARDSIDEPVQRVVIAEVIARALANCATAEDIKVTCPSGTTASVKETAILRAVTNLVTNALHHGAPPIEIAVTATSTMLTISVTDAGAGLTVEEAATLIRPFARGDTARTRNGTGLGLAIAHQAARAHGGKLIFARSEDSFAVSMRIPRSTAGETPKL